MSYNRYKKFVYEPEYPEEFQLFRYRQLAYLSWRLDRAMFYGSYSEYVKYHDRYAKLIRKPMDEYDL